MNLTRKITGFAWVRKSVLVIVGALFLTPLCHAAETFVTSNDPVLMQKFVAATTAQFFGPVNVNPFTPGTYAINITTTNPNYVAPGQLVPSAPCNLDQDISSLVAASTQTYLYGWRDGAEYTQQAEIGFTGAMSNLCQGATNFTLINATTSTWNQGTCEDALAAVVNQLFSLQTGTPTVIPGEP